MSYIPIQHAITLQPFVFPLNYHHLGETLSYFSFLRRQGFKIHVLYYPDGLHLNRMGDKLVTKFKIAPN